MKDKFKVWRGDILRQHIAKTLLRYQRGNTLANIPMDMIKLGAYIGMIKLTISSGNGNSFYYAIIMVLLFYFSGRLDERFGFWKYQNEYSSEELNPFFKRLKEQMDRIEESLKVSKIK